MLWYATAGHHPDDVAEHRDRTSWYANKTAYWPLPPPPASQLLGRVLGARQIHPAFILGQSSLASDPSLWP